MNYRKCRIAEYPKDRLTLCGRTDTNEIRFTMDRVSCPDCNEIFYNTKLENLVNLRGDITLNKKINKYIDKIGGELRKQEQMKKDFHDIKKIINDIEYKHRTDMDKSLLYPDDTYVYARGVVDNIVEREGKIRVHIDMTNIWDSFRGRLKFHTIAEFNLSWTEQLRIYKKHSKIYVEGLLCKRGKSVYDDYRIINARLWSL